MTTLSLFDLPRMPMDWPKEEPKPPPQKPSEDKPIFLAPRLSSSHP